MRTESCDVLVVGSGAAGSVLAATLAERTDLDIVLVEGGGHFAGEAMTGREGEMAERLYAGGGRRTTEDGAIVVRGGTCVGGGTTVNVALCLDPVASVWERWRRDHGLTEVRARLNVHPPADQEINENNRLFAAGCRAAGISVRRFELNMSGCTACGLCAAGCAIDAKQSALVTYVPDAVKRGVRLVHHCRVETLELEGDGATRTAVGARATIGPRREGSRPNLLAPGPVRFRAGLVIVAAGAIESPALLQRSGHPDPHDRLGRGLVLHPSLGIIGLHEHQVAAGTGIEGTMYSDHFVASHGFFLQCLFAPLAAGACTLPGFGPEHFALMRQLPRLGAFGVMLLDGVSDQNRVVWDPIEQRPRIQYRLGRSDRARMRFAARLGVEVMFAAGAREVLLPSEEPVGPLETPWFRHPSEAAYCSELALDPHSTVVASSHAQGTVKMGEDPATSVVNARCESHQVQNLMVCDSSVFPTSCGVNPMLSVMTLARYQGRRLAAELGRHGL
jgi:choline dehydrogenase-like flavoprotein